jgi:hypothetical protein
MVSGKIMRTTNYGLFRRSSENRPVDMAKHRRLRASMEKRGFLRYFPILCKKGRGGNLVVIDGQHRLELAEQLGLPVFYIVVEDGDEIDAAELNATGVKWVVRDYVEKHAAAGLEDYVEAAHFAEAHGIPLTAAFSLLAGTVAYGNIDSVIKDGGFKIKDRQWADAVVGIYGPLRSIAPHLRGIRVIQACMRVCRVPGFDARRLLDGAKRCRDKLVAYSTVDAYMAMLEEIYNFGRKQLVPLKMSAEQVMRDRGDKQSGSERPESAAG